MKLIDFVRKYRTPLLFLLIIMVFVNFHIYGSVLLELKRAEHYEQVYQYLFSSWLSHKTFKIIVIDGGVFFFLSFFNALLSACVLFVYFKANKAIVKIGAGVLGAYWIGTIAIGAIAYIVDWKELFVTTRQAMGILPSPLVEASLIPILKLYQKSKEAKDKAE